MNENIDDLRQEQPTDANPSDAQNTPQEHLNNAPDTGANGASEQQSYFSAPQSDRQDYQQPVYQHGPNGNIYRPRDPYQGDATYPGNTVYQGGATYRNTAYQGSAPYQSSGAYQQPYRPEYVQPSAPQTAKPKKTKKKRSIGVGRAIALMLCCAVIGGAMGVGGMFLSKRLDDIDAPARNSGTTVYEGSRNTPTINTTRVDTGEEQTPAEVYAANVNSTVGITTSITTNFWGYQTTSAASGSGFILTADGYILTNYHVIEGSSAVTVTMYDGTGYEASVVGYDESNDIAVLKIDAQGLTPVVLGDSEQMHVGDPVVAIGNPLGELTFSLTQGAISAMEREITMSNGVSMNLLQTDCAINSGNSGGALFNLYGEVIGITNAKYSGNGSDNNASIDNIGFAIPINSIRSIVESIIEKGYISKPYIGVSVTNVSAEAQNYGLPKGAAVVSVVKDGPAEEAGLQENDIITTVNGVQISDRTELGNIVRESSVGDTLELTVYRQGTTLTISVTVGEQVQSATGDQQQGSSENGSNPWGGFGFGN